MRVQYLAFLRTFKTGEGASAASSAAVSAAGSAQTRLACSWLFGNLAASSMLFPHHTSSNHYPHAHHHATKIDMLDVQALERDDDEGREGDAQRADRQRRLLQFVAPREPTRNRPQNEDATRTAPEDQEDFPMVDADTAPAAGTSSRTGDRAQAPHPFMNPPQLTPRGGKAQGSKGKGRAAGTSSEARPSRSSARLSPEKRASESPEKGSQPIAQRQRVEETTGLRPGHGVRRWRC